MKTTTIEQTIHFAASREEVYNALMNSAVHSEFTGATAVIGSKPGDTYSAYDGYIEGEILELEPPHKIVKTWSAYEDGWPEGHWSKVTFTMTPEAEGTALHFLHEGVPAEMEETFRRGWEDYYWNPMKAMFGSQD
ncbi:MAG: SRPBCC domain-containing protein [Bacteroidetes bacterium]|nr:SRPBCC domain-containing protein [Bacteroidota bacterium]